MRNPSTPYTVTQCRSASHTSRIDRGRAGVEGVADAGDVGVVAVRPASSRPGRRGRGTQIVVPPTPPSRCGWARRRGSPRCPRRAGRRPSRRTRLDLRARHARVARRAGRRSPASSSPSSWSRPRCSSGGSSAIDGDGQQLDGRHPDPAAGARRRPGGPGRGRCRAARRAPPGAASSSRARAPRGSRSPTTARPAAGRRRARRAAVTTDSGTWPSESTVLSTPVIGSIHPAAGRLQVGDAPDDPPGVGVDEDLGRVGPHARPTAGRARAPGSRSAGPRRRRGRGRARRRRSAR